MSHSDSDRESRRGKRGHRDSDSFSTSEAVALFNSTLENALEIQRKKILEELVPVNSRQEKIFAFNKEGNKIQYDFNLDRIKGLDAINLSCKLGKDFSDISGKINQEIRALNQRNKVLKIADKYGWDTAREYSDDPIAENNEDASKLRTAISNTSAKLARYQPYNKWERKPAGNSNFQSMSPNQFFRGLQASKAYPVQQSFRRDVNQQYRPPFFQQSMPICYYCGLPGHIAKNCQYTTQLQYRRPATATSSTIGSSGQ